MHERGYSRAGLGLWVAFLVSVVQGFGVGWVAAIRVMGASCRQSVPAIELYVNPASQGPRKLSGHLARACPCTSCRRPCAELVASAESGALGAGLVGAVMGSVEYNTSPDN